MNKTLLADPATIRLERIISGTESLTLVVTAKRRQAQCPRCQVGSSRVHSRYVRQVADLPWQGVAIRLQLLTRRFRCTNDLCQQHIFCERLPSLVACYARKTARLADALTLIGFCLGGRPGARLSAELAMRAGRDALLRLVRRAPQPEHVTPVVLGVDDWAKRKGHTYGTILVDMQRRRPVDLLPDREAATFAAWLRAHPGVQVISRDRGGAYAEGARAGAPHAIQVADRWHLLKNLGDALERLVTRDHAALRQAAHVIQDAEQKRTNAMVVASALGMSVDNPVAAPLLMTPMPTSNVRADQLRTAYRNERRRVLYDEVVALHERGLPQRAIARQLGLARNTVRRYVRAGSCPAPLPRERQRGSALDRHRPYMLARWREGCTNAKRLWCELREQGFRRGIDVVRRFVSVLRERLPPDLREHVRQHTSGRAPSPCLSTRAACSPREVVWLPWREPSKLDGDGRTLLDHLFAASADITIGIRLRTKLS